jgi:beta-galactosidase
VYRELARLGQDFHRAGSEVVGLRPDAQVGLLYSARSKWGLAFQAAFPKAGSAFVASHEDVDQRSYHRIFEAFYRGTFAAGVSARLLHDEQLEGLSAAAVATELPVLIVPGLLVATDGLLDWLREYAAAGGHLVIGPRTAYGDAEGRARIDVKPGRLAEAAGVRYQEFSNLEDEVGVLSETDGFEPSDGAAALDWIDGLISEGSKIVLGYDHPHFGQFPAIVTTDYRAGRITTVGTLPNDRALGRPAAVGHCPLRDEPGRSAHPRCPQLVLGPRRDRVAASDDGSAGPPSRSRVAHPARARFLGRASPGRVGARAARYGRCGRSTAPPFPAPPRDHPHPGVPLRTPHDGCEDDTAGCEAVRGDGRPAGGA